MLLALAGGRETSLFLQTAASGGGLAAMSWAWLGASLALAPPPTLHGSIPLGRAHFLLRAAPVATTVQDVSCSLSPRDSTRSTEGRQARRQP